MHVYDVIAHKKDEYSVQIAVIFNEGGRQLEGSMYISYEELIDIAGLYKTMPVAKTLLIYMNCILHNDENSIDCIGDGDFVINIIFTLLLSIKFYYFDEF